MTESGKSQIFNAGMKKRNLWRQGYEYESFQPNPINRPYQWSDETIPALVEESMRLVGEVNAYSTLVPDVDFFISMHVYGEAVKSSQIEGTKTDMGEAVLSADDIAPERRDDWDEVQNYIAAMNYAIGELDNLPVCMRLLNGAHAMLMSGVRGEKKQPGEIRTMQNWIGGADIKTASFVPPHQDDLPELLKDLESFWNNPNLQMPNLIKLAISHYQFETIHPYNDGNGRVGRMLIVLQLIKLGILKKPTLYMSYFLEKNKSAYYNALTVVRERDDMDGWIVFFLRAVIASATKGRETFEKIIELRAEYNVRIVNLGKRAKLAHKILPTLFSHPAISVAQVSKELKVVPATANTLVNELGKIGLLEEVTGHSRNRIFILHEYLELFKD